MDMRNVLIVPTLRRHCRKVKPFVVSLSNHERLNFQALGFCRSPFDKLRANGKILNLMAVTLRCGNAILAAPAAFLPLALLAFCLQPMLSLAQSFECLIEPRQVIEVRTPMEGLIEKVEVDRGGFVRQGQVLITLDTGVDRARLELARYKATMRGPVREAESRVAFSSKKLERQEDLYKGEYTSAQDRDEAETNKHLAEAELIEAHDNNRVAQLEVREQEEILRLKTIRSPFDGVVTERLHHPGEVAEANDRTPILKLAQIDPLHVEVILPTSVLGKVRVGDEAQVVSEVPVAGTLTTRVTVIDPVVDAASGTFGVRLELKNPGHKIPAGIRCHAEFKNLP